VLLLRDDPAGGRPQLWMMTRVDEMAFAAGASVFPGGRVDDDDADLPWHGRSPATFAAELGSTEELARALVGAAVRETFEETGVLLTMPPASLAHLQPDVEDGRLSFGALLSGQRLALDADALRPWARRITPERGMRRRYDARFFIAALPAGAQPADLTRESVTAGWTDAAAALAARASGERLMLPPTATALRSIEQYGSVAEIFAAAATRSLEPF
jgi:8-oxo-dGTP pyrophosphatase MutT (NUDIX family)